ncbi:surface carbohydrate biosynthesis protein [Thermopetrobacter sp. TC1]|uniref:surface carbohydrate biosynthesis protein n=1 Tax=Thermopetrobacter sp. TC1 TaxID=1495045 RepID=UPI0012E063CD|nr:surface carbohydrate biosynthesis protein [Thermopetrobacter sp. TC1]
MPEKVLILPIDIKSREFDARLLHALVALERGWTVITGSKTLINRAIWRLPRGVYLFSTMAQGRLFLARMLKKMGYATIGWDEEGLVYADRDLYLAQRISVETMRLMDSVHAWGQAHAEDLREVAMAAGHEVKVSGNPRLDLLKPRLRPLYAKETERIKSRFGNFLLVATNFSWANPHVITEDKTRDADRFRAEGAQSYIAYQRRMKQAFIDALDVIAPKVDLRIIVRPHPVENMQAWTDLAQRHENILIERSGAIIPWILASNALLHSNSTTGVEARLLDKPAIAFVPFSAPRHESPLPNGVSIRVTTAQELLDIVLSIQNGDIPDTQEQDALLARYVHMQDDLCAYTFVKEAERLWQTPPPASALTPLLRMHLFLRHGVKSLRYNHPRDIHRRNIYPDTSLSEIEKRMDEIARAARIDAKYDINVIGKNIYKLYPK